jgi:hypothetical protein
MSKANYQDQIQDIIGRIGGEIIRARGTAHIFASVAGNILFVWSGECMLRQKLTFPLQWLLRRIAHKNQDSKSLQAAVFPADVARLLTLLAAAVNEAHAKGAPGEGVNRGESIRAFLENLDFGEIMEMAEGSDPYVIKAIEAFNEELWKYPAKVGSLVATVIAIMNILVKGSREILLPIEQAIGPDLLADMLLSVLKGLNGTETAKLINTVQEFIRRLHTGSLLLGKGGKPLMQSYLTDLLKEVLSELDPELVRKVRIIFAEDKLSIANAVSDALTDNPNITLSNLASMGSIKSSAVKASSRRLRVYEEIGQAGLNAALSESMSDLDTYEIALLINSTCRVLNRIHRAKPDILNSLASGVVDSLSAEEVGKTVNWLIPDLVQALKPLAPTIMPVLIRGLCEMINPDAGFESAEQAEAMQTLRATLAQAAGGEK